MTTYTGLNGMAQFIAHAQEQQAIREWFFGLGCIAVAGVVCIAAIAVCCYIMADNKK